MSYIRKVKKAFINTNVIALEDTGKKIKHFIVGFILASIITLYLILFLHFLVIKSTVHTAVKFTFKTLY